MLQIAVIPIGYADGFIRAYAEDGCVMIRGHAAPICGRICMDQCMVDVTDLPVTVGTPVTLFGETSAQLESLADRAHTIPYELLCAVSPRVPRVYED